MTTDTRPPLDLDPDAPHDPARTRQLADVAAEAVRTLNYATQGGRDGLTYPADAYDLLGTLGVLTQRLPQLCDQIGRWLSTEQTAGRLAETSSGPFGGNSDQAVTSARSALAEAGRIANRLTSLLGEAQSAISGVEYASLDSTGVPCPDCSGRGLADDDEPCLNCGGTGWDGGPE